MHRAEVNKIARAKASAEPFITPQLEALIAASKDCWDQALAHGEKFGYRNSQVTVLAPTGTIGFMMDCDTTGIEPDLALVKYKKLVGGGMIKIVNNTVPGALFKLGYSDADVQAIVSYIDATGTIEGAPHIKPEHLAVFDCSFKPAKGTRSIHYLGHLKMMAATQPFLSGAISKTVNLPHECTVDDIAETYVEAWRLGLKAVAIYRDGSKGVQVLNTSTDEKKRAIPGDPIPRRRRRPRPHLARRRCRHPLPRVRRRPQDPRSLAHPQGLRPPRGLRQIHRRRRRRHSKPPSPRLSATPAAGTPTPPVILSEAKDPQFVPDLADQNRPPKAIRHRLPEERASLTHKFSLAGHEGYITVGLYPSGEPGEIFIRMAKEGSTVSGLMDSFATAVSLALQHGVPLKVLVEKFAHTRFEPSGWTGNEQIGYAKSIMDYIFRWLQLRFLSGHQLSLFNMAGATASGARMPLPLEHPRQCPCRRRHRRPHRLERPRRTALDRSRKAGSARSQRHEGSLRHGRRPVLPHLRRHHGT